MFINDQEFILAVRNSLKWLKSWQKYGKFHILIRWKWTQHTRRNESVVTSELVDGIAIEERRYTLPDTTIREKLEVSNESANAMAQPVVNVGIALSNVPKYTARGGIGSYCSSLYLNTADWGANRTTLAVWTKMYT